jgi:two-component system nitrate/nitrite response regulator NarL
MSSSPGPIRILLVDDHALFRKGIASLLKEQRDFEVIGEAANGREALEKARNLMPDIILMDLAMPEMDGLAATRQIKEEIPQVRIVILTVEEEDNSLFEAVKSGAQGYLLKKIEPQALFGTLRGVAQGEASISRVMAGKLLEELRRQANHQAPQAGRTHGLTSREREILELVSQGKSNKEVAKAISIAENTVKNHLKNVMEKLHLENRVQAATYALREGLSGKPPKKTA